MKNGSAFMEEFKQQHAAYLRMRSMGLMTEAFIEFASFHPVTAARLFIASLLYWAEAERWQP